MSVGDMLLCKEESASGSRMGAESRGEQGERLLSCPRAPRLPSFFSSSGLVIRQVPPGAYGILLPLSVS